jgi:hypothetical protein
VSDLRLGRFLQDAFAEIPFDSLLTTNLWGRIQVGSRITAELGYRSLVRSDYDRALNVDYAVAGSSQGPDGDVSVPRSLSIVRPGRRTISQTGPTASIQVPMRRMSYLRLDGWVIIQRITHRLYGPLPAEDADRIRQAAADGTRTLIPNLTVSMQWIF